VELTLFLKRTNSDKASCRKTIQSLKHKDIFLKNIIFIDNLSDINYGIITTDWWLLLYDDEIIEKRLISAFIVADKYPNYDVFSLYKSDIEGKITFCPRLFKKEIQTYSDRLYPIGDNVRMEFLLDGWIFEQGKSYVDNECSS
jgi:hypothetical protein